MNSSPFKYEGWLYWLAFLIALGLRLIHLGTLPLTDSEARLALQALELARGEAPLLDSQPGYILLTGVLFGIINTTNFLARLLPALVGSALVFAPYFFRDKIKPRPALILAFLFAIDPGLVALSRQANGTMLAVTFLFFAWAMWRHQRLILAGVFAGLALLSGPSLWAGLFTLSLTWLFLWGLGFNSAPNETTEQFPITNYQLLKPRKPPHHLRGGRGAILSRCRHHTKPCPLSIRHAGTSRPILCVLPDIPACERSGPDQTGIRFACRSE